MRYCLFALAVVAASFSSARADALYAIKETGNILTRIDLPSLTYTEIGPLGITFDFGGMAYNDDTDTLYLIDGRGAKSLYTVDINTGAATLVGSHGLTDLFGLEYDTSTNTLYASQYVGGSGLYTLNMSTGAASVVNASLAHPGGGLAYDSIGDRLINIDEFNGDLWQINRTTGAQNLLYDGVFTDDSGLAFDPARNLIWNVDWNGALFSFDVSNSFARTTHLSGSESGYDGLAYVVPEPSSLFVIALAGLSLVRRTRM